MKTNSDVDFVISDEDMKALGKIERIKDYGSASMMPVFGGEFSLKNIVKSVAGSKRD